MAGPACAQTLARSTSFSTCAMPEICAPLPTVSVMLRLVGYPFGVDVSQNACAGQGACEPTRAFGIVEECKIVRPRAAQSLNVPDDTRTIPFPGQNGPNFISDFAQGKQAGARKKAWMLHSACALVTTLMTAVKVGSDVVRIPGPGQRSEPVSGC
jgi:hypothetical protein